MSLQLIVVFVHFGVSIFFFLQKAQIKYSSFKLNMG